MYACARTPFPCFSHQTMKSYWLLLFVVAIVSPSFPTSSSQPSSVDSCNGIFISYNYTSGHLLPPYLPSDPTHQPYRFESTVIILNNGLHELKSWKLFLGFQNNESLYSASNAFFSSVETGAILAGYPLADLKTAVQTAGDYNQMGAWINLVGTQFGVGGPDVPLPNNITLANDGFSCPNTPTKQGRNVLYMCCIKNSSAGFSSELEENFLLRQYGDLTIMYDVMKSYDTNYLAQVTISNHNPVGRLDDWKLNWEWSRNEFIGAMRGAYTRLVDASHCIFGSQGQYYRDMDMSNVLNCERRPTIIDLPPTKANDSTLGLIPFCCRNGTILPLSMDASRSKSVFQMQVYKMPPDLNRSYLIPPQNFNISGSFNPDYTCGPPTRVAPSMIPDPSGIPSDNSAIASWQVTCNIVQAKRTAPKCCVSFSAFYNEKIIPCSTCACGCKCSLENRCSAETPAVLMPPEALLVPFENRTDKAIKEGKIRKADLPNPLPCGDNCGVTINWHLLSDYRKGWSARMTIFNWQDNNFIDWFAAVEFSKAGPGFEAVYSFNGSALPGTANTIFVQGLPGLNYLVAEHDGANPKKDFRQPGKLQSVISFTKKTTPGIDVAGGDGFPSRVLFNGEECSIPAMLPTNQGHRTAAATSIFRFLLVAFTFTFYHLK